MGIIFLFILLLLVDGPPNSGIELLSASNKDLLKYVEIIGKYSKVYDRSIKGFSVFVDDNIANPSKLNCPSSQFKYSLGIIQPLLVFQILAPSEKLKALSFEIIFIDNTGQRRRLHFSTNFRTVQSKNELHAQIPLSITRGQWCNLVFNLNSIVSTVFKGGISYAALDSFTFRHSSSFRKIFTLPSSALSNNGEVIIPAIFDYPLGCNTSVFSVVVDSSNNISTNANKVKPISLVIEGKTKQRTTQLSNQLKTAAVSPLKINAQSTVSHNRIISSKIESNINTTFIENNERMIRDTVDNHDEEILQLLNTTEKYEDDNVNDNHSNQNFYDYIENYNNDESNTYEMNNETNDETNDNDTNEAYDNLSPKDDGIIAKVIQTKLFDKDQILTKSFLQKSIFNFHNTDNTINDNKTKREQMLEKVNRLKSRLSTEELSYRKEYEM